MPNRTKNTPDATDLGYYRLEINDQWERNGPHRNECADRVSEYLAGVIEDRRRASSAVLYAPLEIAITSQKDPDANWSVSLRTVEDATAAIQEVTAWARAGNLCGDNFGQHYY